MPQEMGDLCLAAQQSTGWRPLAPRPPQAHSTSLVFSHHPVQKGEGDQKQAAGTSEFREEIEKNYIQM